MADKKELPDLDRRIVQLIPAAAAEPFHIIPVAGDISDFVLVAARPLIDEEVETPTFVCPGRRFRFADPPAYAEVRQHLTALIRHYYPREEGVVDCTDVDEECSSSADPE